MITCCSPFNSLLVSFTSLRHKCEPHDSPLAALLLLILINPSGQNGLLVMHSFWSNSNKLASLRGCFSETLPALDQGTTNEDFAFHLHEREQINAATAATFAGRYRKYQKQYVLVCMSSKWIFFGFILKPKCMHVRFLFVVSMNGCLPPRGGPEIYPRFIPSLYQSEMREPLQVLSISYI